VRAFYEDHPYPAPIADLDRHRDRERNPGRRRALSLLLWPTEPPWADRRILVAGCGTSQAAVHVLREPDADVTAIDVSQRSLRHTRALQQKYGSSASIVRKSNVGTVVIFYPSTFDERSPANKRSFESWPHHQEGRRAT
jgi:SAM-dependent methyltransferase